MPELPEVETTIRDLNNEVVGLSFVDVWTDSSKMIETPKNFEDFRKEIKGKKIEKVWRRGKNIIFNISNGYFLLIHQRIAGHLLYGRWVLLKTENGKKWESEISGPLSDDPMNKFLHMIFWLSNGYQIALSDSRKFAKINLLTKKELDEKLSSIGLEPLEKSFSLKKFREVLKGKKGKIKQILMDQKVISGIGNIYSDEILWEAMVNPTKKVSDLSDEEIKNIYQAIRTILKKAIKLKGSSIIDFRRITGKKGNFKKAIKVYHRDGEKCFRCGTIIEKMRIGGRTAHFCPKCQPMK